MEKENENFIDSQLVNTEYYNHYKILEDMGFDKLMIKKVYLYIKPKSLEDSIQFMTKINNIYQHNFFPKENNKCCYCGEEEKYHINYENKNEAKIIDNNNIEINDKQLKKLKEKGEKATCRIIAKDEEGNGIQGSGFFCKIQYFDKTIKVLFTNNHILNKESIKIGKKIKLVYKGKIKEIEITEKRFCKTSLINDFTCIEILNEDKIEDFFEIDNYNNNNYDYEDIVIIHYPNGGNMKINSGHFIKICNNNILHSVSTGNGSSGSPIILLFRDFKVIGIHKAYNEKEKLNVGTYIKDIIEYINKNEINCEFNINDDDLNKEIQILNCRKEIESDLFKDVYSYLVGNDLKNDCELYIDGKKINICWKYKFKEKGKHNIKIISKKLLKEIPYMFYNCSSLISLDLCNFNTNNVTDMSYIFSECSSLTSLNLSNFNTNNVTNMEGMFYECSSLTSLNLFNFNTNNVTNMSHMFSDCSSLTFLNLSNFNTNNVNNMKGMFWNCSSLTSLNLSNFNTNNVNDMSNMFDNCSSLASLNLSNFNTNNVKNIWNIFKGINQNCKIISNDIKINQFK